MLHLNSIGKKKPVLESDQGEGITCLYVTNGNLTAMRVNGVGGVRRQDGPLGQSP